MSKAEQKYRHELKYVISSAQMAMLKCRLAPLMHLDPNAGPDGTYVVRSLYFDDYRNQCFYENENGTDPREKFRIRVYNHSSDRILLECKRKERGKTKKTSCLLSQKQAENLMHNKPFVLTENSSDLVRKLFLKIQLYGLHPVTIVEYERVPYICKNGNVRITFDTHISSSSNILDFFSDSISKRPIMPAGWHLLEVKFDEYLPDYIYRSLNLSQLQQTAYSKYYLCRKFSLH